MLFGFQRLFKSGNGELDHLADFLQTITFFGPLCWLLFGYKGRSSRSGVECLFPKGFDAGLATGLVGEFITLDYAGIAVHSNL